MARIREAHVVAQVERSLQASGRFYVNNHGTMLSRSGVPDFVTMDKRSTLVGIEAKAPGAKPTVNQLRRALEILASGGRYCVAYDGFRMSDVDEGNVTRLIVPGLEIGDDEFDLFDEFCAQKQGAVELVRSA